MKQSRAMSLVESCTNVAVGYGLAVLAQIIVFPFFGLSAPMHSYFAIAGVFTALSVARSYALRRAFEAYRVRAA